MMMTKIRPSKNGLKHLATTQSVFLSCVFCSPFFWSSPNKRNLQEKKTRKWMEEYMPEKKRVGRRAKTIPRTRRLWKNELIFSWWFSIEHKIINVWRTRRLSGSARKWIGRLEEAMDGKWFAKKNLQPIVFNLWRWTRSVLFTLTKQLKLIDNEI